MLFSEPKIPQSSRTSISTGCSITVSVLFSEPKIPQLCSSRFSSASLWCFSALQRAENSSMARRHVAHWSWPRFQCSSASRKFLNPVRARSTASSSCSFSALQRAENSSISRSAARCSAARPFQCSSASRKFLNTLAWITFLTLYSVSVLFSEPKIPQSDGEAEPRKSRKSFSALQRAENSSIHV